MILIEISTETVDRVVISECDMGITFKNTGNAITFYGSKAAMDHFRKAWSDELREYAAEEEANAEKTAEA